MNRPRNQLFVNNPMKEPKYLKSSILAPSFCHTCSMNKRYYWLIIEEDYGKINGKRRLKMLNNEHLYARN